MKWLSDEVPSEISCDSLVVPVAPLASYPELPLGILQECTKKIVNMLELEGGLLAAPIQSYGFITPFKGVSGIVGMRRNSFPTLVTDTLLSAKSWGVTKVVYLVPTDDEATLVKEGIKRYKRKLPKNFKIQTIAWQSLPKTRLLLQEVFADLEELWRSEALVAALAHEWFEYDLPGARPAVGISQEEFQKWYRRGMDPEQLRKMSSALQFSSWSSVSDGTSFASVLLDEIQDKITRFMENV